MKLLSNIFLFLQLFFWLEAFAQQQKSPPKPEVKSDSINSYKPAMIDNEEINRIYVGCDNLYRFRRMGSGKLSAKLGNRSVPEKNGFFILNVADTGKYALSIFDESKSNPEQITEILFEAVLLPEPSGIVANKSCGFISRAELLKSDSVHVKSKRPSGSRVLSYKLALVNSTWGRLDFESKNNRLTPEMKDYVRNAPAGTTVLFEYIRALIRVRGAGISVNLPSISFILED
jgi:hypothetical protein